MASDLDEGSLLNWLADNVAGFSGPMSIKKFAGGQSNPTYSLETPQGGFVLRRQPFGNLLPSAHAVDREFRFLAALNPVGFPTPRPIALCENKAVIGSMFYIMEKIEGRIFFDNHLPESTPADRGAIYGDLIATMAKLHQIDYNAVGLGDLERPGNYFARQVNRWTKQYRASQTDDIPEVEKLMVWLAETVPQQERNTIIHGDFRLNNVMFSPDKPIAAAVLDWELATIGDPLADLTYLLMFWVMPEGEPASIAHVDFAATGIPTLDAAVAQYCAATGRDTLPALDWYFAYNLFRLLGILQGVKKRIIDGNASDDKAAEVVALIPLLADAAWTRARLAGAR